jgi:hypothetical protein
MATADDRDDDDDEKAEAEAEAKAAKKKEKAPSESARAATAAEHATGHEDEDEEEDEDEDEEIKPAPKPVGKTASKPAAKRPGAKGPGAARKAGAGATQGGGSLGKSVMLFFVIVIGLGAGFAILGRETQVDNRPKWKVGDTADVEITLVKSDRQDLACAATEEVAGKHCAFEAMNKPWTKGNASDDKQILKPYTTVDRVQFTAAGLWADPSMQPDKLPTTRFTVKCKYKVEGKLPNVGVRWEQTGQWFPNTDWYAGSVTDCKVSG